MGDHLPETSESKSQSLFIEKVAVLLQKDVSENQVVDLHGLTKVKYFLLFFLV